MTITLCTHADRCTNMEGAHAALSAQLADALAQLGQARAQLTQAQAQVARLQEALADERKGKAFYEAMYSDKCKEAH